MQKSAKEKSTPMETKEKKEEKPKEEELTSPETSAPEPYIPPLVGLGNNRMIGASEPKPLLGDATRALGPQTALTNCYDKMEVRQSPIEGYGVFASKPIEHGTVLEEIPFIMWPRITQTSEKLYNVLKDDGFVSKEELHNEDIRRMFGFKHPSKYYFKWYPPNTPPEGDKFQCLPLGFGPIYNSANGLNNANWEVRKETFIFRALTDIEPDEEIMTFYGYMVCEDSSTFNTPEVFGFGLEYAAMDDKGNLGVLLRNLRFSNEQEKQVRFKEEGCMELLKSLQASHGRVRLRKISVIDGNEEKHPFEFPDAFTLKFHFMKLQEFKQTRFSTIKIGISYVDAEAKKEVSKDILWINHNLK